MSLNRGANFDYHFSFRSYNESVFHQRQKQGDSAYWMFGNKSPQQTYLYAIASRVDRNDDTFTVYGLRRACIPNKYANAENEAVTST